MGRRSFAVLIIAIVLNICLIGNVKAKSINMNDNLSTITIYTSTMNISEKRLDGATNNVDCTPLFDDDVMKILKNILKAIQYAGPVLVGILTIIDLIKAAASGEAGELKKVYQKSLKRLIAAILLFFVPVIVNLLIRVVDNSLIPEACL